MRHVRADRGAVWMEDLALPLQRNGRLEEAYFTFSYSPVRNEAGDIEGLIDVAVETTRQVVDQRRMRLHGRLREALADVQRTEDVAALALPVLRGDPDDSRSSTCAWRAAPGTDRGCPTRPRARSRDAAWPWRRRRRAASRGWASGAAAPTPSRSSWSGSASTWPPTSPTWRSCGSSPRRCRRRWTA